MLQSHPAEAQEHDRLGLRAGKILALETHEVDESALSRTPFLCISANWLLLLLLLRPSNHVLSAGYAPAAPPERQLARAQHDDPAAL